MEWREVTSDRPLHENRGLRTLDRREDCLAMELESLVGCGQNVVEAQLPEDMLGHTACRFGDCGAVTKVLTISEAA